MINNNIAIERIDKGNTGSFLTDTEILTAHDALLQAYLLNLKDHGVKSLWQNPAGASVTTEDISDFSEKLLQMVYLYTYRNKFVHKDLISEFVRSVKPGAGLDQQVRHLGSQCFWYVLNKGARVPGTGETVPSGYHYLVSVDVPNPKIQHMKLKRSARHTDLDFENIKKLYSHKCATCGAKEGEIDWRTGNTVFLQQGHMNPTLPLTADNTIPQCPYCNQTYRDNYAFDEMGRVKYINNPSAVLKSPDYIQAEMYQILKKRFEK